jgi:predicted metal-binding membrane protein
MTPLESTRRHPEVVAVLLAAAGLAWWWTVERMAGMEATPGTDLGTLGWFTGTWVVMMAAMMLPSFAPTLTAYVRATRRREPSRWLLFAGGYLLAWAAVGVLAYAVFELGKSLLAGNLAWDNGGRWLAGGVLAAAGVYQFIPFKRDCLTRCRGQLGDLRGVSRQDRSAALRLGARSGGWCIGSSWALMAALFALGVMSLIWMALIAALVALEKTSPWPRAARLATATVLVVLAAGLLAAPHQLPGLVIPGHGGMHSMKAAESLCRPARLPKPLQRASLGFERARGSSIFTTTPSPDCSSRPIRTRWRVP